MGKKWLAEMAMILRTALITPVMVVAYWIALVLELLCVSWREGSYQGQVEAGRLYRQPVRKTRNG